MLVSAVMLYVAAGTGVTAPAATFTPEGFFLVYGPLGALSMLGVELGRRYVQTLKEARAEAEARAAAAEARLVVAVQRESDRADRAEARTVAVLGELSALNAEVRHDVVPALTAVTRTMNDVLVSQRNRP
jgi:hypothetical protein